MGKNGKEEVTDPCKWDYREKDYGDIWNAVLEKRYAQDEKWGGQSHDDTHGPRDWACIINIEAAKAARGGVTPGEFQQQMLEVMAVALAAIESAERVAEVMRG